MEAYRCRDCGWTWVTNGAAPTDGCPQCGGSAFPLSAYIADDWSCRNPESPLNLKGADDASSDDGRDA